MSASIDFIKQRATATISAAKTLQSQWVWQEKGIADMEAALLAITGQPATPPASPNAKAAASGKKKPQTKSKPKAKAAGDPDTPPGQEEIVAVAEQAMLGARGAWDTALDQLHRWTAQGLGMARTRFRGNPAAQTVLAGLTASANSRSGTLDEALDWEKAWAQLDPAWSPLPANNLTDFSALRKQCLEDLQNAYSDARTTWRNESGKLAEMASALDDIDVAWYADATRVFPAGTPEGDMLRGTIPTTYAPPPAKPAPAPALAAAK